MKKMKLQQRWAEGGKGLNGWCAIPNPIVAELMACADYDSLTIDLQHGLVDYQTAVYMLQALSESGITPMARVPWNEPAMIMKMLDAGALGIICPMVNTAEECAQFVGAMKYAPEGYRSSGPVRAGIIHGPRYHDEANDSLVSFAMVETKQAVDNLEAIASTPGLTGIYIGPSDLSVSMGYAPGMDRTEPEMDRLFGEILAVCKEKGIKAAIHCLSAEYLNSAYERGFDFATLSSDIRLLMGANTASVTAVRR